MKLELYIQNIIKMNHLNIHYQKDHIIIHQLLTIKFLFKDMNNNPIVSMVTIDIHLVDKVSTEQITIKIGMMT